MPVVPFEQALPNRIVITSDLNAARDVEEQVLRLAESLGYSSQCAFAIRLSLEEAIVNAHRHGNRGDSRKKITISYDIDPRRAIIRIRDEGSGFDPASVPDPTCPERICLPNGRGIMLMRSYLDEVTYNRQGNEVQLVKERC
ncbi:MAG TPA: ATP-binding protein [Phycisphaerae bacterium]|nr:ATP-binding protein [Phycisphaerae bacterium]HOJ73404.1 ATP-binding protein [Phycisphaerae bacterium]HOM51013.1 ATP-binding protein [Phycisphaerae bacterium]HOQ87314.1 ATP-binding protein [Phycisphaerae bacterium]HPP25758.1 ATP-binding protein [Phycisphaerae bacterium]